MAKKTEAELLEAEISKGNYAAYYNLGYIYLLGQGVSVNEKKAVDYFRKGASHQDSKCMQGLAMCYKNGDGVEVDLTKTVYWLNQGVKLSDVGCMYQLGLCYENGLGVDANLEEAISLMQQSAMKNKDAREWLKQHGIKGPSLIDRLLGGRHER